MPSRLRQWTFGHYANDEGLDARVCCCDNNIYDNYNYDLGWDPQDNPNGHCNDKQWTGHRIAISAKNNSIFFIEQTNPGMIKMAGPQEVQVIWEIILPQEILWRDGVLNGMVRSTSGTFQ